MLLEKARQLTEAARKKSNLQNSLGNLQGLKTRDKEIERELKELEKLIESLRLFRQKSLIVYDFKPKVEIPLEMIDRTVEQVRNDPSWILDNQNFNAQELKKSLSSLKSDLQKQLLQAWKNYLQQKIPNTNLEVLQPLSTIELFKPAIQKIRQLDHQINRERFPRYLEEFEHTEDLIRQLIRTWDDLDAKHIPDSIRIFLKSANSNAGASFDLCTSEVQDWLKEYDLLKFLKIKLN